MAVKIEIRLLFLLVPLIPKRACLVAIVYVYYKVPSRLSVVLSFSPFQPLFGPFFALFLTPRLGSSIYYEQRLGLLFFNDSNRVLVDNRLNPAQSKQITKCDFCEFVCQ